MNRCCSNEQVEGSIGSDGKPRAAILGTPRNLWIIGFYTFCLTFMVANSISFIWYFNYLSFIYFLLLGLVTLPFTTYNQIIIGYFGDKIETRWGRRKPCIAIATVVFLICMFCLAVPPGGFTLSNQKVLFGWGALFLTIMYIVSDWIYIPLNSWFIESTADNDDYRTINTIPKNIGGAVGGLMGFLSSAFLPHVYYTAIAAIVVLIATSIFLYFVPNTQLREPPKQPDLIPSLRTCMRSKEFRTIFVNKVLLFSALGIAGSLLTFLFAVGFFPAIRCYKDIVPTIIVITVLAVIGSSICQLSLQWVLARFDKLRVYRFVCLISIGLTAAIFPVALIPGETGFYLVIMMSLFVTFSVSILYLIDSFFVRDLIVFDQFVTGLRRENMYQTAMYLPSSLFQSVAGQIPLAIINMSGFVSNTGAPTDDQIISRFSFNTSSIWQLRVYSSFLVALVIFLANRLIKTYALNDKVAAKLNDIVKQREEENNAKAIGGDSLNPITAHAVSVPVDVEKSTAVQAAAIPMLDETDEDLMYMNHLSQSEISIIHGNFKSLSSLKLKVSMTIVVAFVALVVNLGSMGLQINIGQGSFVVLTITLVLFTSLYIGYEILRLIVIQKLSNMLEPKAKSIILKAHEINKSFFDNMARKLKECGIDDTGSVDAETDDERQTIAAPDKEELEADKNAVPPEQREVAGYKRIIFFFVLFLVYGIFGCTLLVYHQTNPANHTPTLMPTVAPSLSATLQPTIKAICHGASEL